MIDNLYSKAALTAFNLGFIIIIQHFYNQAKQQKN